MTRRRADKLDRRSREARLANGFVRMEIELPVPDAKAVDEFAELWGVSRSKAIVRLIRGTIETTAEPADATRDPFDYEPPPL